MPDGLGGERLASMSTRDLEKELSYWVYNDPEYGDDITNLDYPSLIGLLTELVDRIEKLEYEVKTLNRKLTDDHFEVIKNE